ncbi:MAG: RMD1 family protein [Beijerinckiaceae bacterium]
MNAPPQKALVPPIRLTARALLLGDRIDAARLESGEMISTTPVALKLGDSQFVALYRFGVAVFIGFSQAEEDAFLANIAGRIAGKRNHLESEVAIVDIASNYEDRVPPGGPIEIPELSPARFLVIADVLAKTVSLARDEGALSGVFDVIEPFAAKLMHSGRTPWNRRAMLKLIGQALLVQHRIAGRVAVEEKPDILWDHPSLERLYARLEDEYEVKERAQALTHKLNVIVESGQVLTDIFDVDRSTRLEAIVVILILTEILITLVQIYFHRG